jgi:hypothetical protein
MEFLYSICKVLKWLLKVKKLTIFNHSSLNIYVVKTVFFKNKCFDMDVNLKYQYVKYLFCVLLYFNVWKIITIIIQHIIYYSTIWIYFKTSKLCIKTEFGLK